MTQHSDDLVKIATGQLVQVQAWGDVLQAARIVFRVVGDNLAAGLGTALPGSVELWVRRTDVAAAEAAITEAGRHFSPGGPELHSTSSHGRPVSDPKPGRSHGPRHGAPPHRPLPS